MNEYETKILNRIEQLIFEGKLSNEFLVSNLKLCSEYLNLQRISDASKNIGKTTQHLRKSDQVIKIAGYQLFINNE